MINILDKYKCCGCSACVQVCPKQCIAFNENEQGFRYPIVNKTYCIDCGLCEKVCPCINQNTPKVPKKVYAAINPNDEIRMTSSSGGIFSMLAEIIIDEGGVVFGARFDKNWEVIHDYTETKEGLAAFRGSKYVQSQIGNIFVKAKDFLKEGRKVLFSGTSCQIAGLKRYLRKEYTNLLTVDIVCHGVPSPLVWRDYVKKVKGARVISKVSTKYKNNSWRRYNYLILDANNVTLVNENSSSNQYHQAYLLNLSIRRSCFNCPSKDGKANSDITLGDCWGIERFFPEIDDDKGVSYVACNSHLGLCYIEQLDGKFFDISYNDCVTYNSCITESTKEPLDYNQFWSIYSKKGFPTLESFIPKNNFLNRIIKYFKKQ